LEHLPILGGLTALLSNIVRNVPAVLVLKPFVGQLPDPQRARLVVAIASILAGNFTLVGSVANLIVVQRARAQGVEIGFRTHFKVGAPLTVLTLLVGMFCL
jgi:Na+/H+ antiporter NhaD/arsenite permease-like protein